MSVNPFLKKNKKESKPFKVYVSEDFVDKDGKPYPFTMKILSTEEARQVRDDSTKPVWKNGVKVGDDFDQELFQENMLIRSIVDPDLNNTELINSWEVNNANELLNVMLNIKERSILQQEFDKHYLPEEALIQLAEQDTKNA